MSNAADANSSRNADGTRNTRMSLGMCMQPDMERYDKTEMLYSGVAAWGLSMGLYGLVNTLMTAPSILQNIPPKYPYNNYRSAALAFGVWVSGTAALAGYSAWLGYDIYRGINGGVSNRYVSHPSLARY